jgi:hypothetical protein
MLNTMVFTHLPSNVLIAMVPLMPTLNTALIVLFLRQVLNVFLRGFQLMVKHRYAKFTQPDYLSCTVVCQVNLR